MHINGQIVFISEPDQIIDNINDFTQYEHLSNLQLIGYVKKKLVGGMIDQQWDAVEANNKELKNFELDIEIGEMQEMDAIPAKFTTIDSMFNVAFVMAEKFNTILNFCSGVFELQLFYDGNRLVQAMVKELVFSIKYADFADIFSPTLACELPPHALYDHAPHDHAIETRDGQPLFDPIYLLSAVELNVLKKYIKDNLEKGFIVPSTSSAGAPILFTKKKNRGLQLCMDY